MQAEVAAERAVAAEPAPATTAAPAIEPGKSTGEGRIARHSRLAREAWDQPRSLLQWSRDWLVRLWITKGGGFYGLGYVVTFVTLEARSLTGDVAGSSDISDFITTQLIQYVIRFSVESFLNALFSVFWPIYLLRWNALLGIAMFIGIYLAYRIVVRPSVEGLIPELREAREAKAAKKAARKASKAAKRAVDRAET